MTETTNHIRIATASIPMFSKGEVLTSSDINGLLSIALEGGKEMHEEEKRVLGNTFKRIQRQDCDNAGWDAMQEAISKYGIEVPAL